MTVVHKRLDYRPLEYRIPEIHLLFGLGHEETRVTSRMLVQRITETQQPLILDGVGIALESLKVDGRTLAAHAYELLPDRLVIQGLPETCEVETVGTIRPAENTRLEGLYASRNGLFTQCEPEGFRRISWFLDRPDNLARFFVRIEGDKDRYPVLLSNGNPVEEGDLGDGRRFAVWNDPFPKPSYLFALVAGKLACIEDTFQTKSARNVRLRVYAVPGDEVRCHHAMRSIRQAMVWDEKAYGREYDLDVFNVVAVEDFNVGAMENKGLNIFNSKYVLADSETATDADFLGITRTIGHEYFHNWSGDRVTCRDWFQLSLKEGFTVFREQQFMESLVSPGVQRIGDIRTLRAYQFAEDAGPMAHPVRPDSYEEINNFYTMTIYEKGAEVIRMLRTLLGAEAFRTGCDLYFSMHDGKAVTCDDFVRAMELGSGRDLSAFRLWYSQAGKPEVTVEENYNVDQKSYSLTLKQKVPPTPGQDDKSPMPIPVSMALLGPEGGFLVRPQVLLLDAAEQNFYFPNVGEKPILSILRGFSAPVELVRNLSLQDALVILGQDDDAFSRWDVLQAILIRALLSDMDDDGLPEDVRACFAQLLERREEDPGLLALLLSLPESHVLSGAMVPVDMPRLVARLRKVRSEIGRKFAGEFEKLWQENRGAPMQDISPADVSRRQVAHVALGYLVAGNPETWLSHVEKYFEASANMTERLAALALLVEAGGPPAEKALEAFYTRHKGDAGTLDKWFSVQARADRPDAADVVLKLLAHPDFCWRNPNRVRSLVGVFSQGNPAAFHAPDGAGYRLLADAILKLDGMNPQISARLMEPFTHWRKHAEPYYSGMQKELERIAGHDGLSANVREIVSKTLG
ncbi:MAG TPA: aminopeptidase N [Rhodospirillaceae bacterium]|nr:MAG: aminopeptidase N [Alphaproteobacteria bacterium GWF2_58_20]HAU29575.1 aminopeptidase N [Rhodospirillaceae bacterium]